MNTPQSFYQQRLENFRKKLKEVTRTLRISSFIRLCWFFLVAFSIYFFYPSVQYILISVGVGIAGFLFLITRHNQINYQKKKTSALVKINERELNVLDGNVDQLPSGEEYVDPIHAYSHDIDLFGKCSFFQYLNRTNTPESKDILAFLLSENKTDHIAIKQEAIKELSEKKEWRQDYSATASLLKAEIKVQTVLTWLQNYRSFLPGWIGKFTLAFSIASLLVITACILELISMSFLTIWFFIGLGNTGIYLKKITVVYNHAGKAKELFNQYYQLVESIEQTTFKSELLKEKQTQLLNKTVKASQTLKRFFKILDALDQRNNMIYGIFGNAFLLWDIKQVSHIEKWIALHKNDVEIWFECVNFIDAYNSLGNFAFNHPTFVFPKITNNSEVINAQDLGHPLLSPVKRVDNNIIIKNKEFFIITGANMAGKSTFLRTVALQIVMSNVGLPVCATSCTYSPTKLITSMRTSDSLSDDSSYFFSELTQLKHIVDVLEKDNYFIILDEILKGTNSKDKAEGSKKFVEKLVRTQATGIIATHDLSLCKIAEEIPVVKNKYFDAQIINDELYFDYKFKEGICQNMNASFLLSKMGIV
ncbi:DNA mismatch repair protein MutS [Aquimarina sp. ERC-38]|uniref:MutS-related protein n=1 Tax=Aquimarina sp. ERC-38 TaxID=2949996 RepID=UPI002247FCBC|nr:DNA mismatch repair protein MutS [Aquimarina sp. ERC-38]UZO81564.1 DNA mismatch repair protein MutS [Aquimarina sp. ERC-38]